MKYWNRRNFINKTGFLSLSMLFGIKSLEHKTKDISRFFDRYKSISPEQLSNDEDFWHYVRQSYTTSESLINLNNGGVAPSPRIVQEAVKKYFDLSNEAPSYYMWRILDQGREPLREKLALTAGCDKEEIALQRNASEALETVIFGLPLKAGDEIVLSKQDYPNMINAWKQREERDKIVLKWIDLKLPSVDEDYLVEAYTSAFTSKTKVVHITHIINWNGQILPAKKIAQKARQKGIEVLVDGAHSFAHFKFSIKDLECDYFGTSLHKWLSACIGTGFLYVKRGKIESLYPMFGSPADLKKDIRKFESLGTRPFFIEQATGKAIEFYNMIGADRKEARLNYLKNYWIDKVKDLPNIQIGTPLKEGFSCAIAIVNIKGKEPADLDSFLQDKYKVHVVSIIRDDIKGIRVTPNVYTSTADLDILVKGIRAFAEKV